MDIKSELIKILQNNSLLRKTALKCFNKINLGENSLNVSNIHFKNNYIRMKGIKNNLTCAGQSFLQHCKIYIVGTNNTVIINEKTEFYGENLQNFHIDGKNNQILIGKNCKIRNTTFFIRGNNNVIELKDDISAFGAEFHIEQNGNYLQIRKGTTFHRRNGYPIHIALDEGSTVLIDEDCMFSNGIQIRSTDSHSITDIKGNRINYAENIKIGKHCWIGLNCIILKGTQIAPHTVVAAGSICTSSYLRENCIIAGNPARIVKQNIDWDRKFV